MFQRAFWWTTVATIGLSAVLAQACGENALDHDGADASSSARDADTPRDASKDGDASSTPDAAAREDADAPVDPAPSDVGTDAASPVDPEPGDTCPTVGERFERACGSCGVATAMCTVQHVVGGYGNCVEGSCVDAGAAPDAGPDVELPQGLPVLELGNAVGQTSRVELPTSQGGAPIVLSSGNTTYPCPLTIYEDLSQESQYAYVVVHNPNPVAAVVDLKVSGGGDGWLAVYASLPQNIAQREACMGSYDNGCGQGSGPGCLTGAYAPTVPAHGYLVAYVARYFPNVAWQSAALQAEVRALP